MANEDDPKGLERIFIMIRPDHLQFTEEILERFDAVNGVIRLVDVRVDSVPREVIEELYAEHRGKSYFGFWTAYFIGKPAHIAVYEGGDVIKTFRTMIGNRNPAKAEPTTIRGHYSNDSLEEAMAEERAVKSVIHSSDSPEATAREIAVLKDYLPEL